MTQHLLSTLAATCPFERIERRMSDAMSKITRSDMLGVDSEFEHPLGYKVVHRVGIALGEIESMQGWIGGNLAR